MVVTAINHLFKCVRKIQCNKTRQLYYEYLREILLKRKGYGLPNRVDIFFNDYFIQKIKTILDDTFVKSQSNRFINDIRFILESSNPNVDFVVINNDETSVLKMDLKNIAETINEIKHILDKYK